MASGLGAVFIAFALIGYRWSGCLAGTRCAWRRVFGVVAACDGPLLLRPAAVGPAAGAEICGCSCRWPGRWALPRRIWPEASPRLRHARRALITAGVIIWRDRAASPAWQTVTAGLLLTLMIAWSGHEDVLAAWHSSWLP
jgi:hypothetical protein